jgi:hypothetical protein
MIWSLTLAATILLRSFAEAAVIDKVRIILATRKIILKEDI